MLQYTLIKFVNIIIIININNLIMIKFNVDQIVYTKS